MKKDKMEGISQEIARAMERAAVTGRELPPEEVIIAYDNIQGSFLPRLSGNPDLILELKRRAAEWKFRLLSERNRPLNETVPLFEAVRKLGFSTYEREGIITICFAKYLLRNGEPKKAKAILDKLAHKLDRIMAKNDLEVYRDLRRSVALILQGR